MANINAPFGLRAVRRGDGAAWTSNHTTRKMQNNAGACNRGDVVKSLADGTVAVSTIAAGDQLINVGVVEGFHYLSSALGYPIWTNYWPGSGALGLVDVFVIDDPFVVFEVMAATGPITLTDVGANAPLVYNASTTGFSKWALGTPAVSTGSDALPLRIVGLGNNGVNVGENGYDAASANNIVEVAWNLHYSKTLLAT